MTDLISRQDAIALLESLLLHGWEDWEVEADVAIKRAIKALTNMPSAEIPIRFDEWDAIP